MAVVTNFGTLKTAIADWLNRSDLDSYIPNFVQNAEANLHRDPRVRNLETATYSITGDDIAVPSGFKTLESWYHDGATYFGEIEIVSAGALGNIKARIGQTTGVPSHAAILDGVFRFAPAPDGTYSTKMTYWQGVSGLASGSDGGTNWLLTGHPDIYLYASLIEASPYLKDDDRVSLWEGQLEKRLEALHRDAWDDQWSGALRRQFTPIGG